MLQTLYQTMEVKLQVMSALCMTWRHMGNWRDFSNHLQFRNYMEASVQHHGRTTPTNTTLLSPTVGIDTWWKTKNVISSRPINTANLAPIFTKNGH